MKNLVSHCEPSEEMDSQVTRETSEHTVMSTRTVPDLVHHLPFFERCNSNEEASGYRAISRISKAIVENKEQW
jgi:hypothetical protein